MEQEYVVTEVNVPDTKYEFDLVASLLTSSTLISKDILLGLDPECFVNEHLKLIWTLYRDFVAKDIEPTSQLILSTMKSDPSKYPSGTLSVFSQAVCYSHGAPDNVVLMFINEIKDRAKRREIAYDLTRISKDIANPSTNLEDVCVRAQKVFNDANNALSKDEHTQSSFEIGVNLIRDIHDALTTNSQFVFTKSGFNQLDQATMGFRPSSYNIIAGRPGAGKTAFALNIMTNLATTITEDKPVLFFSLEMDKKDVMQRVLCNFGRVPLTNLLNGEVPSSVWPRIVEGLSGLAGKRPDLKEHEEPRDKFYICDKKGMSASEMWMEAKRVAKNHDGLSLIVVDYIQIVKPENSKADVNQQIKESNQQLLCMAQEFGCPLLVLSQLNRDIERRSNKAPTNADLRDSGALEADATVIMFLWKEGGQNNYGSGDVEPVTLSITKNRHGQANIQIPMHLFGSCFHFEEIEGPAVYRHN